MSLIDSQNGNIASREAGEMSSQLASDIPLSIEKPLQLGLVGNFTLGQTFFELRGVGKVRWEKT
jgi:hypothetical protein